MLTSVTPARLVIAASLLLVLGACGHGTGATTSYSCVGPYLDTVPPGTSSVQAEEPVHPGDTVTIYGHGYTTTCNDTGGNDAVEPMAPAHLMITWPGGSAEPLGTFTPLPPDLGFRVEVEVPAGTPSGVAKVRDREGTTYRFRVD